MFFAQQDAFDLSILLQTVYTVATVGGYVEIINTVLEKCTQYFWPNPHPGSSQYFFFVKCDKNHKSKTHRTSDCEMNQVVVTMPIITSGELVAVTNEKKEQCKSNSPGKTVNNEAMTTSVRPELQDNNEAEANTTGVDADNDDASFNAMEDDDEYSYKYEGGDDLDRSNNMAYFFGLMISPPDAVSDILFYVLIAAEND